MTSAKTGYAEVPPSTANAPSTDATGAPSTGATGVAPVLPSKIQAALAAGLVVQSDWQACPLGLDGLDLLNRNTLTFALSADPAYGDAFRGEKGELLRIVDCVLLYDTLHKRYLSVPLNATARVEAGSTLVLAEKTLRAQTGLAVPHQQVGWLSGHGAFS